MTTGHQIIDPFSNASTHLMMNAGNGIQPKKSEDYENERSFQSRKRDRSPLRLFTLCQSRNSPTWTVRATPTFRHNSVPASRSFEVLDFVDQFVYL
jgi:hypothetical protein